MTNPVETDLLKLRLVQAQVDCVVWAAAGHIERLQVAQFVAATLGLRLRHRLKSGSASPAGVRPQQRAR